MRINWRGVNHQLAGANGFSLHAGVSAKAHQRRKLERLCRYIARPAVATGQLALTRQEYVRYTLKTPYRDGTTHIILEPLDFIARLAALVARPRVNLTRFHGVFAPNSQHRSRITPARRGKQTLDQTTGSKGSVSIDSFYKFVILHIAHVSRQNIWGQSALNIKTRLSQIF